MKTMLRIERLRKTLLETRPRVCTQRARIVTRTFQENEEKPMIIRRALSFANTLKEMPLYIEEDQLLLGNQTSYPRGAPLCPEYSYEWILDELDSFEKRPGDVFLISEEDKALLREILPYWKNKTLQRRAMSMQHADVLRDMDVKVLGFEGNVTAGEGHYVVDYDTIVTQGLPAILKRVQDKLDALDYSDPASLRKMNFYKASKITLEGVLAYIARYEVLARETAKKLSDAARKAQLEQMAENCAVLLGGGPQNFYQALQLVNFINTALHIETNGHSISFGRMDQYLYPFYAEDLRAGRLDEDFARELVCCFYLKVFSNNKIRPWSHTRFQAGYPTYQNIALGGSNARGEDETNALSFLMLDALRYTRLSDPNVYIRVHKNIDRDFLVKALDVVRMGFGIPAFVGDKVITRALMRQGVSREDAFAYSTMGCTEVLVPGKWGYRVNGKSKVNMLKILEIFLHGGVDARTGKQALDFVQDPGTYRTFDEFMQGFYAVLDYYIRLHVIADNINDLAMEEMVPDALTSVLTQDCLERGKTLKEGGAVYDIISGVLVGLANMCDALFAVKKIVFDTHLYTLDQVLEAADANYKGMENQRIRAALLNRADKYGNDEEDVDAFTKEVTDHIYDQIEGYKNMRAGTQSIGAHYTSSTVGTSSNVPCGSICVASLDGRYAFEPTNDGMSPSNFVVKNGPTGVIHSITKLSTYKVMGGQLLNMRINPTLMRTKEQLEKVASLILTLFDKEGWHVQFNVVDNVVLRDAQSHPEQYSDLVVRVAGYSALFNSLDRTTQDDIIARCEYEI